MTQGYLEIQTKDGRWLRTYDLTSDGRFYIRVYPPRTKHERLTEFFDSRNIVRHRPLDKGGR